MDQSAENQSQPAPPGGSLSDEELMLRFRDGGDQHAFDALVHRYERELFGFLKRYLGDVTLAEDVFQATFLNVFRKGGQYEAGRRVRPWLYSIATHLAVDALRRAGHRPDAGVGLTQSHADDDAQLGSLVDLLQSKLPSPSSAIEERERNQRIEEAVDALPDHLRFVILLIFFQGLKYSEAAEVLGVPLGTVKSRLHAALARLHQQFESRHLV